MGQLNKCPESPLIIVMRQPKHYYYFEGRGKNSGIHPDPYRFIQCGKGSVIAIIHICHGIPFISGYCRKAMFDPWGLYCYATFERASNSTQTRSWAEPSKKEGVFYFRKTRLEIVKEEPWMTQGR